MGYMTKLQVISRKNNTEQYYLMLPAPLGRAIELVRGEEIELILEDKNTIIIKRVQEGGIKQNRHSDKKKKGSL